MNAPVRPTLVALVATASIFASAPAPAAGDGGATPLSAEESYALTCGHLGVACDPPHKKKRRAHRAGHRAHR
jgi:hypothetical protein